MKRTLLKAFACCTIAAIAVTGCNNASKRAEAEAAAEAAAEQARQDSIAAVRKAIIEKNAKEVISKLPDEPVFDIVTNMGTIKVKLYKDTPKHRENFEKLALTGFYNGTIFHRVIDGFMIQGGDPYSKDTSRVAQEMIGQGGPGYTIPAEFIPEYKHVKGALAAARRGDVANPKKESSGSQFYIVQDEQACAQLNGDYTVFGIALAGLDVVDRIAKVATGPKDRPLKDVTIKKIVLEADPDMDISTSSDIKNLTPEIAAPKKKVYPKDSGQKALIQPSKKAK